MFSKTWTQPSTAVSSDPIEQLKGALASADAVVVGAGAGLSASAGMTYSGERFRRYFSDFQSRYDIQDMYSGGFYPFESLEEYWAWWSRQILVNRYEKAPKPVYGDLLKLIKDKDYFVLTTNVDHQFQLAGFDKQRLFYTQGDYGLWQCSKPCHQETYDNEETVRKMFAEQRDMRIPTELVPQVRLSHGHEPAVRRYLRPGCGLVCRRPAVRGLPTAAQGTAAAVPGAGGGRQHPGHHQVSLLEDDPGEPERCLCLYQSEGVLYSPGDSGAVCLHPCGHRTYSETTHPAGALRPSSTRGGTLKSLLAGDPCINGTEVRKTRWGLHGKMDYHPPMPAGS